MITDQVCKRWTFWPRRLPGRKGRLQRREKVCFFMKNMMIKIKMRMMIEMMMRMIILTTGQVYGS